MMMTLSERQAWGEVKTGPGEKSTGLTGMLTQIAYDKFKGVHNEIDFMVTLILSGGKERDWEYLEGELFQEDCKKIQLDPNIVLLMIKGICDYFDHNRGNIDYLALQINKNSL